MLTLWMLKEMDGLWSESGSLKKTSFFGPVYLGVLDTDAAALSFKYKTATVT